MTSMPSAIASPSVIEQPATIEQLAALEFRDEGPELSKAIGTHAEWIDQANSDWTMFCFAEAAMRKNDVQTHAIVQEVGTEAISEFADALNVMRLRYVAMAELLHAAEIRNMCGLARVALGFDGQNAGDAV